MNILITGSEGRLSKEIIRLINCGGCNIGKVSNIISDSNIIALNKRELDITNTRQVMDCMNSIRPDVVINCASYTDVEKCEENEALAFKINALGPRNLAISCEKIKSRLMHISTDYVFDGIGNEPLREYDLINPVNKYGKTKSLGENYVKEFCSRYFIVRTSWLYGSSSNNFVCEITNKAKKNKHIQVYGGHISTPTNMTELAYHILIIIKGKEYGIYHCTGNGQCTMYDIAEEIIKTLKIDCVIDNVTSKEIKRSFDEAMYSVLDNMMLRCTIGDRMRYWKDSMNTYIKSMNVQ